MVEDAVWNLEVQAERKLQGTRGGEAFGDQDAERFCGIGHGSIIAAPGTFVFDFWITFSPPEASPEGSHAALFMDK